MNLASLRLGIREQVPRPLTIGLGAIPVVVLLGLWWLLTAGEPEFRVISPVILPSPGEVLVSFPSLWFDRALARSIAMSFYRVLGGFFVALLTALPLGIAMGSFSKVKAAFTPITVLTAYLPIPALVPLTMSLFGTGEGQKVAFLAIAFFAYLVPLTVAAVDAVDGVYLQSAAVLGANRWQMVRSVLIPVALPRIFHALRLGFGVGWGYIILAEMVAAERGLGNIIIVSQRRGPKEHIYLVLVVIVLIAFLTDKAWAAATRRLFPYEEERR